METQAARLLKVSNVFAVLVVLMAGCAAPPAVERPVVHIRTPFDEAQAAALLTPGVNIVKGSGFMRQQGGGVVTCAGNTVTLVPATGYAQERFGVIYGGSRVSSSTLPRGFSPDPPAYRTLTKTTRCNAQGGFSFDQVADGNFFVVTVVSWKVGYSVQGGALYAPVSVRGGQAVEVTLAP